LQGLDLLLQRFDDGILLCGGRSRCFQLLRSGE